MQIATFLKRGYHRKPHAAHAITSSSEPIDSAIPVLRYRTSWEIFRKFPVSVTMRGSVGPVRDAKKAERRAAR